MSDLPKRIIVDQNGHYWRDFGDSLSMCPVSEDNEPVVAVASYALATNEPPEPPLPCEEVEQRLSDALARADGLEGDGYMIRFATRKASSGVMDTETQQAVLALNAAFQAARTANQIAATDALALIKNLKSENAQLKLLVERSQHDGTWAKDMITVLHEWGDHERRYQVIRIRGAITDHHVVRWTWVGANPVWFSAAHDESVYCEHMVAVAQENAQLRGEVEGLKERIRVLRAQACKGCDGLGSIPTLVETGEVHFGAKVIQSSYKPCPDCNGTGAKLTGEEPSSGSPNKPDKAGLKDE